jgi:DNA-directed RNA polymerase subunit F
VALWFLLHYPEGEARYFAWQTVLSAEENPKIQLPDRYLISLIPQKNPELEWLLDQRTKDLIRGELSKIAKPLLEEAKKREEVERLFNEVVSTYRYLSKEGKAEVLRVYGGEEKFQALIDELKENLDAEGLREVLAKLKEVAENDRDELDDLFWSED